MSEDVILGADWLHKVSPYTVDTNTMTFTCFLNGKQIVLPASRKGIRRCPAPIPKVIMHSKPAQLAKMDRSKYFSEVHGEKMLKDITEKLKKYCCAESPNAF